MVYTTPVSGLVTKWAAAKLHWLSAGTVKEPVCLSVAVKP